MHNGNGHGHGSGKRWLLIGLLILGGFWLLNDAYEDGYRDALVRSGQVTDARVWRHADGPHFPWGLLIVGGFGYFAWRKGFFDRFQGPGGNGQHGVQPYGGGNPPSGGNPPAGGPGAGQGFSATFRGPRALFEEWHRQSHEAARTPSHGPAPRTPADQQEQGTPGQPLHQSPPPPPPAPDYWNSMGRPAETPGTHGAPNTPGTSPAAPDTPAAGSPGGPAPERW